jgi:hypothetical protein
VVALPAVHPMLRPMPLRVLRHTTMARLIVLRTPRQRTVEANTEAAANTINLQVLTFVVASNTGREDQKWRSVTAPSLLHLRGVSAESPEARTFSPDFLPTSSMMWPIGLPSL